MNILSKAVAEIKFTIPREILEAAFRSNNGSWRESTIGLDEKILSKVIRPRVLVDCDNVGGRMVMIPVSGLTPLEADQSMVVYTIPKELTGNRSIISALSMTYLPYASGYGGAGINYSVFNSYGVNSVMTAAQHVSDAVSDIPFISTGYVELIGENTVYFRDVFRAGAAYFLRCILGNEENLNNISPRSYYNFAKLCEYAIKSYIYTKLIILVDKAFLQGGQELGSFKNVLDSMADSEELYGTYLQEVWRKVAFMNDTESYTRFIKSQFNTGI
jgi:hypothetical protein